MKRRNLALGAFVRKDKHDNDCLIGDQVRVTRDGFAIYDGQGHGEGAYVNAIDITGTLVLGMSQGVVLYPDKKGQIFNNLKLTDNCRQPQTWELIRMYCNCKIPAPFESTQKGYLICMDCGKRIIEWATPQE